MDSSRGNRVTGVRVGARAWSASAGRPLLRRARWRGVSCLSPGDSRTLQSSASGFTLVELLIVVAIIALLVSILATALGNVRGASRRVMCMNQLREVSFRFSRFAEEAQHPNRGESEQYGPKLFRLEDFQESVYRIQEFWDAGAAQQAGFGSEGNPLICPAGPGDLVRRRGLPCTSYAVSPGEHVSIAFNMRLEYVSVVSVVGARLKRTLLTPRIKSRPWVPLAFDIDGLKATQNGALPYYSAPSAGDPGMYGTGRFWFPSTRHLGRCNVAFVGGHVLSSPAPERVGHWQWSYQPPVN